jgi:hypothetical protein
MQKTLTCLIKVVILISILAIMAGCGRAPAAPASVSNPTPDVSSIKTEAAKTVIAQITVDAVLPPGASATNQPQTETQVPVASLTPSLVATLTATATNFITFTPIPTTTATPLPTIPKSDQAQLIYRTPKEWAQFKPGDTFDVVWTIQNIGAKTWNKEYFFTYFNGTKMNYNGDLIFIDTPVNPGARTQFTIDMQAPQSPGNYTTSWALYNDNKEILGQYFITIVVVGN